MSAVVGRRGLLGLTAGLLVAPALVRAEALMPVREFDKVFAHGLIPLERAHVLLPGDTLRVTLPRIFGPLAFMFDARGPNRVRITHAKVAVDRHGLIIRSRGVVGVRSVVPE